MAEIDQPAASTEQDINEGWSYSDRDEPIGPHTRAELKALLASRATDGVKVWHPSLGDWTPFERSPFYAVPLVVLPPPLLRGPGPIALPPEPEIGFWATLFTFQGRIGRQRFLGYIVLVVTVGIVITFAVLAALHLPLDSSDAILVRLLIALPFVWMNLALTSKRLHDLDLGTVHLLWVAPADYLPNFAPTDLSRVGATIAAFAVTLVLLFKRGTPGPNRFGPDPLSTGALPLAAAIPDLGPIASPHAEAPRPRRLWVGALFGLGAVAAVGIAAVSLDSLTGLSVPRCADQDVVAKVKQIIVEDRTNQLLALMSGGMANVIMTPRDMRTVSNDEPLHGRTCVLTLQMASRDPQFGKLGAPEVTYTVQTVDGEPGQYVVTIK